MTEKLSPMSKWNNLQVSKTALFWCCAGSVVAALVAGFSWGGWVTGGTAREMARTACTVARAEMAAGICVTRFAAAPESAAQLASLKATSSWQRNDLIEKAGWVTIAGGDKPISGAAELCVQQLLDPGRTGKTG
jgi:hypothetical protein